jgi:hypothetical protein
MAFSKKGNHCSKKVLQDFQVKKDKRKKAKKEMLTIQTIIYNKKL